MAKKTKSMLISDKNLNLLVNIFPSNARDYKVFSWNEIMEITIKDDVTGLLFKKPTQVIEILTQNPETPSYYNPILYYKHKEGEYFEEYISELTKYAEMKNKKVNDLRKEA